jgi:HAD superfamily hydrolase (TIGR01490 family)
MTPLAYGSFESSEAFIDAVLALQPKVAAFDCDGTLWHDDSGMKFLYWEIEEGLLPTDVSRAILLRYQEYLAGKVSEDDMCGEMVQIHRGLGEKQVREYAARFARLNVIPQIFPEMRQLIKGMRRLGTDIWTVSSTNNWVIEAAVSDLDIPPERVLAVRVEIENGKATDRLGEMTSGPGKARALKRVLSGPLNTSFGNSIFDLEMLELAQHPIAINPNPDLLAICEQRGWRFYQPSIVKLTSAAP